MNYIKNIEEFLSEAISMKMYKENLHKKYWHKKPPAYKKWDKLFGKNINRISIPLNDTGVIPTSTPLMDEINSIFQQQGYKINSFVDYIDNKAYKLSDTKNPLKVGKLLSKIDPTLFKKYDTDPDKSKWKQILSNKEKALKIIISRHPYDLLGMTSGRDWRDSSCMRLGTSNDKIYNLLGFGEYEEEGQHKNKIKKDIEEGVLVAYVVDMMDDNINNPISRLLIKPYINENDKTDILWVSSDKLYGKIVGGFKKSVDKWLESWQGGDFLGLYCIKKDLYDDGKDSVKIYKPKYKWTDKDREEFLNTFCIGIWTLNSNDEVDVDGSVSINSVKLTEIPVKFGKVGGSFICYNNHLTSLEGCPSEVGGNFYCYSNRLTSLEGCPSEVGGRFDCSNNQLISLEFCPSKVDGSFDCHNNQLTSLEFCPSKVGGGFYCYNNQLTSLEGCPSEVGGWFDCSNNQLTSLEFCPSKVSGSFYCSDQKNGKEFTREEVRSFSRVGGGIYV